MQKFEGLERELSFSLEVDIEIEEIIARYPEKQAAVLPMLWLAQREFGYIDRAAIRCVAERLDLTPTFVLGTYSFYTMFRNSTTGRHHIQVCRNLACWLRGYDQILSHLQDRLGIAPGETTEDQNYTLSVVECLGSCGTAPMMQIDDDYHENLTKAKVDEILDGLDRGLERGGAGSAGKSPAGSLRESRGGSSGGET